MREKEACISVIVPVYNVEGYIERCLDSIISQTYHNLEILVIDDGSTDKSGEICDRYQKMDSRIVVFHKENEGLAETRNFALSKATGEFIACVDSDDYIEKDMYEILLKYMDAAVDITTCGMNNIYPSNLVGRNYVSYKNHSPVKYSNEEAVKELLLMKVFSFSSCDKLFRRKLFDNVQYPKGKICEDIIALYQLFSKARNVVNTGVAKYNYIYRSNSISRREFYYNKIYFALFARDIALDVKKNYPQLRQEADALYINNIVTVLEDVSKSDNREDYIKLSKTLINILRRNIFKIMLNKSIPYSRKSYYYQLILN